MLETAWLGPGEANLTAPPLKWHKLNCINKRRYACEMAARVAAQEALIAHQNQYALSVYKCGFCSGWHLTKQKSAVMVTADELFFYME